MSYILGAVNTMYGILYKSSEHGYYCMYSAISSNRLVVA